MAKAGACPWHYRLQGLYNFKWHKMIVHVEPYRENCQGKVPSLYLSPDGDHRADNFLTDGGG
jgi:hypothetical protein